MMLAGKNVIVTGASRGFGRVVARTLWEQGASLLLIARSNERLREVRDELKALRDTTAQISIILALDLESPEAAGEVLREIRGSGPPVDGLVNNAGILGPIGPAWENDAAQWERTVRLNLLAPVALCRALVPGMIASGGGAIVNLSGGGATGPRPNFSAYAVAKTGLVRFTENLAAETRGTGVRVNAIAPGMLATDMAREILAAGAEKVGAEEFRKLTAHKPDPKNEERAARLCAFLLSDRAKDISGRLLAAQWDPWEKLESLSAELNASDIYTLRRIVPEDRGKQWS